MAEAKRIIARGLLAVAETAEPGVVGALTDEEHGADAARLAKAQRADDRAGRREELAARVRASSTATRFGEHIEALDPDFVKVLVRYNPEGDAEMNRRQAGRLAELSAGWLRGPPSSCSS